MGQQDSVGIPSVTARKKTKNKFGGILLIIIAIALGLILLVFFIHEKLATEENNSSQTQEQQSLTSTKSLALPVLPPDESPVDVSAVQNEKTSVSAPNLDANGNPLPTLEELKFAAPMMGEMPQQSLRQDIQGELYQGPDLSNVSAGSFDNSNQRDLSQRLESVPTPKSAATIIQNQSLTLPKGTVIECILETRVDTTVPGMTTCIVPRNIYSMDGRVLLVEKGTRAVGEYQGSVANGLARIFMLWTELRTPKGVVININSPAADQLGASGMGGYVDFHWWKRFGNALLFSMVADGFQYIVNTANSNNTNSNVTYENTDDGMSEIIQEAMRQSGNIPPTLIKNQGERISIFVARDLNFENVYKLTYKR